MARGFAFVATLLAAGSMATPAVETDGIGFLADVVMATPAVDDLPIIMSCPPTLDVLPDLFTEAADAFSTAVIEGIWQTTSLPVRRPKPTRRVPKFFTKSFLGDDAAVLARSSGEEPASPRHRAGVASMAWRTTRRFSRTRRKI